MDTPETLKSRLYKLETHNDEDMWVEKCQGYPLFRKEDNIFKLKYYAMPGRDLFYEIIVNSNIRFDKNENGVEWVQIKEGEIMAISFKEEYSANAFWNMIDEYQRKYEVSVPAATGTHFYFQYRVPDPTVDNLHEFLDELQRIPENQRHERLTSILLTKREFLPRLGTVFRVLEDVNELEKLQLMFEIVRIIFNSSNQELLYELMCNDNFMFVLGALEYDPNFKNRKPKHREFIQNKLRMISVVQFKNAELYNLCIITYRLEYVRECVLLPYLNDYSFSCTSYIIRNNYRKILSHIFNPKKKEFINDLFDHLRKQDVQAFKLLREIFRIGKTVYAEDLYLKIAERDFFQLMMKNMRELRDIQKGVVTEVQTQSKYKKKKKPEDIAEIVQITIEILQQFMEYQPLHFKNYCSSESETVSKYPSIEFLFDQFQQKTPVMGEKIENILKILVLDKDNHPIKKITHIRILNKFVDSQSNNFMKWLQLFHKIIVPLNISVYDQVQKVIAIILENLFKGSKEDQINMLSTLKTILQIYIQTEEDIEKVLLPHLNSFTKYFIFSKGLDGIRISIYLSIFKRKIFANLVKVMAKQLEATNKKMLGKYIQILNGFLIREEVNLPSSLKRERSEQLRDDECFQKIQKKIKID